MRSSSQHHPNTITTLIIYYLQHKKQVNPLRTDLSHYIFSKNSLSTSYVFTSLTPIPYSAILLINSSPSIRSICCFPRFEASFFAALVNVPVVIKTPFSISIVKEPLKSRISPAPLFIHLTKSSSFSLGVALIPLKF